MIAAAALAGIVVLGSGFWGDVIHAIGRHA